MRLMHKFALAALVVAALVPLAEPSAAQKATRTMGALGAILPEATSDGAWNSRTTPTGFTMTNRSDANAVRYFYVDAGQRPGARTVQVDVSVEPRGIGPAMAGLLYGFDPQRKTYIMLVIESGETIGIYRRGPRGLERLIGTRIDGIGGGPFRLTLEEQGEQVAMKVDGKRVALIKSKALGSGATGIIAAGVGTFAFSAFSVTSERADLRQ